VTGPLRIPATSSLLLACALALAPVGSGAARADTAAAARADVGERIRIEVQAGLPAELSAIEVRLPAGLAGASANPATPIAIDWSRAARPGWLTLRVTVGTRSGWVRARIAALSPSVVAVRDLPAGHVVGEEDVRVEMRPVAAHGGAAIAGLEGAVGRALRQPVSAGGVLLSGALERAAPFPRGQPVTALIRRGRLTISAAGVLERSAPIGQETTVRLRATGRVVRGRLIDSHTVLIEVSP